MILLLSWALGAPPVEDAIVAELERALTLRLPDSPAPYLVQYDLLDGQVSSSFAELGVVVSHDVEPYRSLRVEVRVGDYAFDSSNFLAFGESSGVSSRQLPVEDNPVALRREIWLATDEAFKGSVEQLSRKRAALAADTTPRPPDYTASPPLLVAAGPAAEPPAAEHLRGLAERLSAELRGIPGVEVGQAVARDWQGRRLLVSSEGTRAWRDTGYTVVRVEGTLRLADGSERTNARSWIARTPAGLPSEEAMRAEVRAMGAVLGALPAAPAEEEYLGPVLFEGAAATELFSQLLAQELLGTPPALEDDSSIFRGPRNPVARLGRRLLPLGWSVVDDPRLPSDALGAYAFDMEGVAPRRVELVRGGVLQDFLMSRIPNRDRGESTGHARALGTDRRAAMPASVVVTPPRLLSQRRLERMGLRLANQTHHDFLLVVTALQPPALTSGPDFAMTGEDALAGLTQAYEAYRLYADGRRELVRPGEFAGVDRRVLRDILAAGPGAGPVNLLDGAPGPGRYTIGATGGIPVTWDVPSVLVGEVELRAAPRGGEPRVLSLPPVPKK